MATSKSEQVLQALAVQIAAHLPAGVSFDRNLALPQRIPAAGVMILRDGDPGEPEPLMSPPLYYYEHRAEVDLLVDAPSAAVRDATFDALKIALGEAIAADRTLGGLCDYVLGEAPAPVEDVIEGGETIKAASVGVLLHYDTPDPLT